LAASKLGAIVLTLAIGACVGMTARAAAGVTQTITMDGTSFKPPDLTVKIGDTIVWRNDDPFPHTATSTAGAFDSKPLAPSGSFTFTPKAKGDYPYKCTLHPTMRGMIHVK
jgi:plastocyanin